MTEEEIADVIVQVVERYASLRTATEHLPVRHETKPYSDLGMDSFHDVTIVCEVEAALGIFLPPTQKLLAGGGRALSIREAAKSVARSLQIEQPTAEHANR